MPASAPVPTESAEMPASEVVPSPPMAPGIGGPNIDLPLPPLRPFGGDIAIKDLRRRLARDPNAIPQPLIPAARAPALPWGRTFSLVLIVAAVVGFGTTMLMLPREAAEQRAGSAVLAPALHGLSLPVATTSARLVIESQRAFANEPLALGISLADASGEETVTLVGLVSGTKLTAGSAFSPTGWQLAARELGSAFAYAPKDFVGAMDAAIDLRSARDRVVDSQMVRLEWMPKDEARPPRSAEPPARTIDPDELALLMKRAEDAFKNGDIAGARPMLRRAAGAGNGQAALALAATYDPVFLAEQGVLGLAPDAAQARSWYERAAQLGEGEAVRRLERMSQTR
jgi:TPR repeat protein